MVSLGPGAFDAGLRNVMEDARIMKVCIDYLDVKYHELM
jgi:hypothetical protein